MPGPNTVSTCIIAKAGQDDGISKEDARAVADIYQKMADAHPSVARAENAEEIAREIAEETKKVLEADLKREKFRTLKAASAYNTIMAQLNEADSFKQLKAAVKSLLIPKQGNIGDIDDISTIQEGHAATLRQQLDEYVNDIQNTVNDATDESTIKEAKLLKGIIEGETEGLDEFHTEVVKAYRDLFTVAREELRMRGMDVNKLENYFPNPKMDIDKLQSATYKGKSGKQGFVNFILNGGENDKSLIVEDELINMKTGEQLSKDEIYGKAYNEDFNPNDDDVAEGITDEYGLIGQIHNSRISPIANYRKMGAKETKPFHKEANQKRALHFETGDDWMKFNKKYGQEGQTALNAADDYIADVSKKLGIADRLGPYPQESKRVIEDLFKTRARELADDSKKLKNVDEEAQRFIDGDFNQIWEIVMEKDLTSNTPYITHTKNLTLSATIGTAGIPAAGGDSAATVFTDTMNQKNPFSDLTRRYTSYISDSVLAPAKELGLYKGMTNQEALQKQAMEVAGSARILAEEGNAVARLLPTDDRKITNWFSDKALKFSTLRAVTRINRTSYRISWGRKMAKVIDKDMSWDELGKDATGRYFGKEKGGFRNRLEEAGITKEEWEIIKKVNLQEHKVAGSGKMKLFRTKDIATEEIAEETGKSMYELRQINRKLNTLIQREMESAIPSPNNRTRFLVKKLFGKGKVGEVISMYKSFPLAAYTNVLSRIWNVKNAPMKTAKFWKTAIGRAGRFIPIFAAFGALQVQAKQIIEGNDPLDMTKPGFWKRAFVASGATPFINEAIFGDPSEAGEDGPLGGIATGMLKNPYQSARKGISVVGSPVVDIHLDAAELAAEGVKEISGQRDANFGRKLVDGLRNWTPGQNTFYTQLLTDRAVFNTMQTWVDPRAEIDFMRGRRRARKQGSSQFIPDKAGIAFTEDGIEFPALDDARAPNWSKAFGEDEEL